MCRANEFSIQRETFSMQIRLYKYQRRPTHTQTYMTPAQEWMSFGRVSRIPFSSPSMHTRTIYNHKVLIDHSAPHFRPHHIDIIIIIIATLNGEEALHSYTVHTSHTAHSLTRPTMDTLQWGSELKFDTLLKLKPRIRRRMSRRSRRSRKPISILTFHKCWMEYVVGGGGVDVLHFAHLPDIQFTPLFGTLLPIIY